MDRACRALEKTTKSLPDLPVKMAICPPINPRGKLKLCEICRQPAHLACCRCRVTFYCHKSHMTADWKGIHQCVCGDMAVLRNQRPFLAGDGDRNQMAVECVRFKERVMAVAMARCRRLLLEEQFQQSIPAALQALKLCTEIHGSTSLEVSKPTLLLSEAHLGLGNYKTAGKYVGKVQWLMLQAKAVPNSTKAALSQVQGKLHAKQGSYLMARRCFADAIYYATLESDPTHVTTAAGYYHLANVFLKEGKADIAATLYSKVTEIWLNHLSKLVEMETGAPPKRRGVGPGVVISPPETLEPLGGQCDLSSGISLQPSVACSYSLGICRFTQETQQIEVLHTLQSILQLRPRLTMGHKVRDLAAIYCALSMLFFILHDQKAMTMHGQYAALFSKRCGDAGLRSIIKDYTEKVLGKVRLPSPSFPKEHKPCSGSLP